MGIAPDPRVRVVNDRRGAGSAVLPAAKPRALRPAKRGRERREDANGGRCGVRLSGGGGRSTPRLAPSHPAVAEGQRGRQAGRSAAEALPREQRPQGGRGHPPRRGAAQHKRSGAERIARAKRGRRGSRGTPAVRPEAGHYLATYTLRPTGRECEGVRSEAEQNDRATRAVRRTACGDESASFP